MEYEKKSCFNIVTGPISFYSVSICTCFKICSCYNVMDSFSFTTFHKAFQHLKIVFLINIFRGSLVCRLTCFPSNLILPIHGFFTFFIFWLLLLTTFQFKAYQRLSEDYFIDVSRQIQHRARGGVVELMQDAPQLKTGKDF